MSSLLENKQSVLGTRRRLNPKLKKGYVPPPTDEHIVQQENTSTNTPVVNKPTTRKQVVVAATPSTTTTTTPVPSTVGQQQQVATQSKKSVVSTTVPSQSALRFEKYEKQHEAFIKQMENFMKSFVEFEKERLAFMKEQFGTRNNANTSNHTKTVTTSTTSSGTGAQVVNKNATSTTTNNSINTNKTTTTTTVPTTTAPARGEKTTTVSTPKKTSNSTQAEQTKPSSNVSSPTKSTTNSAAKNNDPAVDASPTKQTTKKKANENTKTTSENTATSSKTSTPQSTTTAVPATNVPTRELTIPQDDIFVTSSFKPSPIKVVYLSGETKKAIVAANKVFDNLAKTDAVYGINVLWNGKEEKLSVSETGDSHPIVPIRYILLCNSDTVYVFKVATAEEMNAEKIDRPLPVSLYKILTQQGCVKVSFDAITKVTYLFHNLNNTYVSHISDIQSLFKTEYSSVVDLLSNELDLPSETLGKELKSRNNYDYSKVLNDNQLVTVAKRCWLEYRLVEKLSQQQESKTSILDFVLKHMKIED